MKEEVKAILEKIRPGIMEHENENFVEEGILDSLDIMNLIMALEEKFDLEIDPEDVLTDNFQSLDAVVELVTKYMK